MSRNLGSLAVIVKALYHVRKDYSDRPFNTAFLMLY